jgi:hypothetical protein
MRGFDLSRDVLHDGGTDIVGAPDLSKSLAAKFKKNAPEFTCAGSFAHECVDLNRDT